MVDQPNPVFITIMAGQALVLVLGVVLGARGNATARWLLWLWATGLSLGCIIHFRHQLIEYGELSALFVFLSLIMVYLTHHEHLEDKLEAAHEETRRVLSELHRRVEEEWQLVARRVHDDINPSILICRNELVRLQQHLQHVPGAAQTLTRLWQILDNTYKSSRDLLRSSRLEILSTIGFTRAVESMIDNLRNCFETPALVLHHSLPDHPNIEYSQAVGAYMILRESVYNAIKHSKAKTVTVNLSIDADSDEYEIVVADNGVGIEQAEPTESSGIGWLDMRERARSMNATLEHSPLSPRDKRHPGLRVTLRFKGHPIPGTSPRIAAPSGV